MNYSQAKQKLQKYGQEHLLAYYDDLQSQEQESLLCEIESTDFSVLTAPTYQGENEEITPINVLRIADIEKEKEEDYALGVNYLKQGKVALLLLAGGMGTRLGSNKPKGAFNVGVNKELYIFECQINNLKKVANEINFYPYLFIMTSPKNDLDTRAFFEEKNYFGYDKEKVKFFVQKMSPILNGNGKILLENKDKIALSPNGNGGWFISFVSSGLMKIVESEGIEYFNVYSVDNVLQQIADPVFIGATIKRNVKCGSKVIKKVDPEEKLGVMCYASGRPSIIEYFELPEDLRYQKSENGEYNYYYGVILNYLFSIKQLQKTLSVSLPYHKANKVCAYYENGKIITPTKPNAYKLEQFTTDLIKYMETCLPFEIEREKEFAPVKNLTGVDSVDSARELLIKNGVEI